MGTPVPALTVIYSATANKQIQGIWKHKAEFYSSAEHATDYVNFLYGHMQKLSTDYEEGRTVETTEMFRFITMKRSTQGSGHIAVYRITKPPFASCMFFTPPRIGKTKLSRNRNERNTLRLPFLIHEIGSVYSPPVVRWAGRTGIDQWAGLNA